MYVNNLTSSHSAKTNCEQDFSKPLLKDAHELFLKSNRVNYDKGDNPINDINNINCNDNETSKTAEFGSIIIFDPIFSENEISTANTEALENVSSLVCQKIVKAIKCEQCIATLETSSANIESNKHNGLKYPSSLFIHNFKETICGINQVLPHICAERCVKKQLLDCIARIQTKKMGCSKHSEEVRLKFMEHCAAYGIIAFCKNINDLLNGKNTILPPDFNSLEELAYIFHKKKKHIGKQSDVFQC